MPMSFVGTLFSLTPTAYFFVEFLLKRGVLRTPPEASIALCEHFLVSYPLAATHQPFTGPWKARRP